jgi:hypothetical protein
MTYFADLSRCAYFDRHGDPEFELIAVGWLSYDVCKRSQKKGYSGEYPVGL